MAAIQFVLTKYPVSRGAVIQMLARLQHGKGEGIPAVDKVALYMVGGYMMVCYDLPDADGEAGTAQDVRCGYRCLACGLVCQSHEFV